jgi:hypothetical protein
MIKSYMLLLAGFTLGLSFILSTSTTAQADYYICRWSGTAPFCSGLCRGNEIQIKRNRWGRTTTGRGNRCASGTKALCCRRISGGECRYGTITTSVEPRLEHYPYLYCRRGEFFGGSSTLIGTNRWRIQCCKPNPREVWIGTAPFCKGKRSDCTNRGMEYVRRDRRGDGKKCFSGWKVLCRTP